MREPGSGRRLSAVPELTGLRGIAILLVFVYHALEAFRRVGLVGGWVGVDIFFVLSGFLITTLLVNEWDERGGISLLRFYARRALRLLPALVVFLAVAAPVLAYFEPETRRAVVRGTAYALFYVMNILGPIPFLGHTWSLSMEEQFYAVWPIVLLVALRLGAGRRSIAGGAFAAACGIALVRAALLLHGTSWEDLYYRPLHSDGLLVGSALGLAYASNLLPRGDAWRRSLTMTSIPAAAFLGWIAWDVNPGAHWLYAGGQLAIAIAATVVVLAAVDGLPWLAFLRFGPLVYLGRISYALYLWHLFLLFSFVVYSWASVWLAVVASLAAASASYHVVERPFLRLKRRVAPTRSLADVVVEPAPS
ncbi:MAG: hypothetical protein QOE36_3200 [Gaiellaceae bacterium]|jgi:peptidoglycan/LPS O-acetylase OafA/YrhL|nr:hypothetical protein [Gaiellaceae bacterium]